MDTIGTNPVLENSLLGERWFNPDYLASQGIDFFRQLVDAFNNSGIQSATVYNIVSSLCFS